MSNDNRINLKNRYWHLFLNGKVKELTRNEFFVKTNEKTEYFLMRAYNTGFRWELSLWKGKSYFTLSGKQADTFFNLIRKLKGGLD